MPLSPRALAIMLGRRLLKVNQQSHDLTLFKMPTAEPYHPIRTKIAGVGVRDLARQFGTPTYVYDAAKIVERISDLKQFDVIRFAQKACSNIAVLDLVRRHGVLVDAVSAGEIQRALLAGYGKAS